MNRKRLIIDPPVYIIIVAILGCACFAIGAGVAAPMEFRKLTRTACTAFHGQSDHIVAIQSGHPSRADYRALRSLVTQRAVADTERLPVGRAFNSLTDSLNATAHTSVDVVGAQVRPALKTVDETCAREVDRWPLHGLFYVAVALLVVWVAVFFYFAEWSEKSR